ncbi:hypothetical protein AG0111_0g8514 [Alternaria gaisen]|uniref:Uncharacterized protein n=1 Tax=Alternaria gaisen TaxID=167740 RepID=A0ACB6FFP8_9PLEO|nr:hypothetical protein AG0111_0g8514 [Alternaria gaisen]
MQIIGFLRPAALVVTVAGEICQKCSSEGAASVNLKILGAPDEVFVAAGKWPRPATDGVWDSCKQKGCLIEWSMHNNNDQVGLCFLPPQISAESPFQTWEDLTTW